MKGVSSYLQNGTFSILTFSTPIRSQYVFFFPVSELAPCPSFPLQKSFLSTVFPIVKINEKRGYYDNTIEGEILKTENSPRLMRILKFRPNQSCKQTVTASKQATQNMDPLSERWSTRELI